MIGLAKLAPGRGNVALDDRPEPSARPGHVVLEVTGRDAREIEVLAPLAARVRRALSLDVDLADFHRICRADPLLRPLARAGLGRRLRGL